MGKNPRPLRSQLSRHGVRNATTLQAACIALLLLFPGQITLLSRDFNITTQQAYTIVRCHCRQTQYTGDQRRMPSYLTQERQQNLATSIIRRIRAREVFTLEDVRNMIIEQHREKRQIAVDGQQFLGSVISLMSFGLVLKIHHCNMQEALCVDLEQPFLLNRYKM
ncbi:MAG: hypothetical protein EZS28_022246 [Streblomastix strix]|uniref:Uncharacterized protein n=1 Tax=Streblomastix strix TaxID=222440 RepID=A0A5J4VHV8_9EUKA|nr:MAG: hypothetical protein EZS28_022246 [Streblomastix strix]